MKYVMQKLLQQLDMAKIKVTPTTQLDNTLPARERHSVSQEINHAWMWPMLGQWLKKGDVVITETLVSPSLIPKPPIQIPKAKLTLNSYSQRNCQFRNPRNTLSRGGHGDFSGSLGINRVLCWCTSRCRVSYQRAES